MATLAADAAARFSLFLAPSSSLSSPSFLFFLFWGEFSSAFLLKSFPLYFHKEDEPFQFLHEVLGHDLDALRQMGVVYPLLWVVEGQGVEADLLVEVASSLQTQLGPSKGFLVAVVEY